MVLWNQLNPHSKSQFREKNPRQRMKLVHVLFGNKESNQDHQHCPGFHCGAIDDTEMKPYVKERKAILSKRWRLTSQSGIWKDHQHHGRRLNAV